MPCFSTITRTRMTDAQRIADGLAALGWTASNTLRDGEIVGVRGMRGRDEIEFTRGRAGGAFVTRSTDTDRINAVQRKYAEIGVRAWAKRAGYSVAGAENDGRKLTLVNRRG